MITRVSDPISWVWCHTAQSPVLSSLETKQSISCKSSGGAGTQQCGVWGVGSRHLTATKWISTNPATLFWVPEVPAAAGSQVPLCILLYQSSWFMDFPTVSLEFSSVRAILSYFLSTNFPTPKVLWFSPLIFLLGLCLYKLLSWELWQGFMRDCSKMLVFSPVSLLERASFPILSWVLFWKGAQVYLKFVLKSLPQYHLVQNFALNQSCPIQHNP